MFFDTLLNQAVSTQVSWMRYANDFVDWLGWTLPVNLNPTLVMSDVITGDGLQADFYCSDGAGSAFDTKRHHVNCHS
jgi:hypothetical protein